MPNATALKSNAGVRGRYSEDERGYVLDTLDLPLSQVAAHLGRTEGAISAMRRQVRSGHIPGRAPWSAAEDDTIRLGVKKTAAVLANELPGRTEMAVKQRRKVIKVQAETRHKNPHRPGIRSLLAKTCRACGLLLPGGWFHLRTKGFAVDCKKCASDAAYSRQRNSTNHDSSLSGRRRQAISLLTADRSKFEYTAEDEVVLADAELTALEKAIALRRSFFAVRAALFARGIKSSKVLGDKEIDQWLIDNPNSGRIDEITATLRSEIASRHKQWDWDD